MKRPFVILSIVCMCVGCRASFPNLDPWGAAGPQRIPAPPTGSIGQAITPPPYYQPPAATPQFGTTNSLGTTSLGTTVLPSNTGLITGHTQVALPVNNFNSLGTTPQNWSTPETMQVPQSTSLPPAVVLPTTSPTPPQNSIQVPNPEFNSSASVGISTTANGWRSPQRFIQRTATQEPENTLQTRVLSNVIQPTVQSPDTGPSVLVQGPIQIVEPAQSRTPTSVAIRPMHVNDATVGVTEPRRLEPEQLTEITNLPVVRQPATVVSNGVQVVQSTINRLNPRLEPVANSNQWRPSTPRIGRSR